MSIKDKNLIEEIKRISASGKNAEVKRSKDGQWVVYEVDKKKKTL